MPSVLKQFVGFPLYSSTCLISKFITLLFTVSTQILIPRKYLSWVIFQPQLSSIVLSKNTSAMKGQARHCYNTPVQSLNMDLKSVVWRVWTRTMEKYDNIFYLTSSLASLETRVMRTKIIMLYYSQFCLILLFFLNRLDLQHHHFH